MPNLTPGDIVTFPLRGDRYGVALVVHVDDLALNDLYHLAICDAVVEGFDAGEDELGRPLPREHDMAVVTSAPVLIEHIALTRHGLEASDLSVVAERELGEGELDGYRTWLHLRFEDAVRRGVLRERIDDNPDEYGEEQADFEEVTGEEATGRGGEEVMGRGGEGEMGRGGEGAAEVTRVGEKSRESEVEASEEPEASEEAEAMEPSVSAATFGVHDYALGTALIRMRSVFEREAYRSSALAEFVIGIGGDSGAIGDLIARLLAGDFAAGDELIDYGEPGMRALGERLGADIAPELADDILQVLVNSGENVAYERIGAFMAEHGTNPDDPLYGSAVRGYCYAVMLTAGEPEALRRHLPLLESVRDAELADDVRSAREALAGEG